MPELPEVEVVKKSLENKLKNLTIKRVNITNNKLRYKIDNKEFSKIKSQKIISIQRRSKYLIINLKNNSTILVHLGMTGKFFIINKNKKHKTSFYYSLRKNDTKHDHITFIFNKKIKLIYNDVRKFGFIKIFPTKDVFNCRHLASLGPEPLSNDFNLNYFEKYILNKKKKIKDLLMDQRFIAGLGNIYCNEVLFLCKISPIRRVQKINQKEIKKIIKFTKKILKQAISLGGSSIKNFSSVEGQSGNFQQKFNVYGREKTSCNRLKCLGTIKKVYTSNRSSFFCYKCQK
jgi:formamidopyrimidine-DNA glycosylase|tara:strand:+ start:698 stop:1561 length:864 start_codon:yes stop_codon:yes gene_type:complete